MITIAILTTVALTTAILLVPIARQTRIQRETEVANAAARQVLENIQSTAFNKILVDYPNGSVHSVVGLPNGRITISYIDPNADPLVVRADLSWDSPELGAMARTFDTIRTE